MPAFPTLADITTASKVLCYIRQSGIEIEGKRYKGRAGVIRFVFYVLRHCGELDT